MRSLKGADRLLAPFLWTTAGLTFLGETPVFVGIDLHLRPNPPGKGTGFHVAHNSPNNRSSEKARVGAYRLEAHGTFCSTLLS
jgi:hypothetical protein